MSKAESDILQKLGYTLVLFGFLMLVINHISILMGNPWLIPEILRLH
jgi:hypothetical protein